MGQSLSGPLLLSFFILIYPDTKRTPNLAKRMMAITITISNPSMQLLI